MTYELIGVTGPGPDLHSHAWLDGEEPCAGERFAELTRRAPAGRAPAKSPLPQAG